MILTAHLFDRSYNRLDCEFVMVDFFASQVLDNFEIWYQHYMDFSPSRNKKSNVDGVLFLESGNDVYHGDSTAKYVFYFGKKKRFFDLKQSVDHPLTSGYNVDGSKIYKIPVVMLTDLSDVKSKFEFDISYHLSSVSCRESELIKVQIQFVK